MSGGFLEEPEFLLGRPGLGGFFQVQRFLASDLVVGCGGLGVGGEEADVVLGDLVVGRVFADHLDDGLVLAGVFVREAQLLLVLLDVQVAHDPEAVLAVFLPGVLVAHFPLYCCSCCFFQLMAFWARSRSFRVVGTRNLRV